MLGVSNERQSDHTFSANSPTCSWRQATILRCCSISIRQIRSPNSPAGMGDAAARRKFIRVAARKRSGLNENLAREIMELHSLGVDSGYTQSDVTEFARALTGWSIGRRRDGAGYVGTAVFRTDAHEPGARKILGRDYPQQGAMQASSALLDFAASPHTAHHLAVKIARHFVADDAPASLVARLETTYMSSGGRLDRVADALISAPKSWDPSATGIQDALRISGFKLASERHRTDQFGQIAGPLNQLGQRPFGAPSPKGWEDEEADWATPDAIVKRMTWSRIRSTGRRSGRSDRTPTKR